MFLLCPGGCHHFERVSLLDSRPAAEAMVRHIIGNGSGPAMHGSQVWSRANARTAVDNCDVVSEYYLRTRFENQCPGLTDHPPHGDRITGCYGNGPFRKVPPLPGGET